MKKVVAIFFFMICLCCAAAIAMLGINTLVTPFLSHSKITIYSENGNLSNTRESTTIDAEANAPSAADQVPQEQNAELAPDALITLGWYRNHLDSSGQKVYDVIERGVRNFETEIKFDENLDQAALLKCYEYVLLDNPDIFYLENDYTYNYFISSSNIFSINPRYRFDRETAQVMTAKMNQITESVVVKAMQIPSQYERARYIYTWIADNCVYDVNVPDSQTMDSVLLNHVSACAGYSKTFQFLLARSGIPATVIHGNGGKDLQDMEAHAWNAFTLDGQNVYADITWGDQDLNAKTGYCWLGLNYEQMSSTHICDDVSVVPVSTTTIYNAWNIENSYVGTYNYDKMVSMLNTSIVEHRPSCCLKFDTPVDMTAAHDELIARSSVAESIWKAHPNTFSDPYHLGIYAIYNVDSLNAVVVEWQY